jgi:hypothetical protein
MLGEGFIRLADQGGRIRSGSITVHVTAGPRVNLRLPRRADQHALWHSGRVAATYRFVITPARNLVPASMDSPASLLELATRELAVTCHVSTLQRELGSEQCTKIIDRFANAIFEPHVWLPFQRTFCERYVGLPLHRIIARQGPELEHGF